MQFGKLQLFGRGASMPLYPEGHARDDARWHHLVSNQVIAVPRAPSRLPLTSYVVYKYNLANLPSGSVGTQGKRLRNFPNRREHFNWTIEEEVGSWTAYVDSAPYLPSPQDDPSWLRRVCKCNCDSASIDGSTLLPPVEPSSDPSCRLSRDLAQAAAGQNSVV
jgi:hypothetical protein